MTMVDHGLTTGSISQTWSTMVDHGQMMVDHGLTAKTWQGHAIDDMRSCLVAFTYPPVPFSYVKHPPGHP